MKEALNAHQEAEERAAWEVAKAWKTRLAFARRLEGCFVAGSATCPAGAPDGMFKSERYTTSGEQTWTFQATANVSGWTSRRCRNPGRLSCAVTGAADIAAALSKKTPEG